MEESCSVGYVFLPFPFHLVYVETLLDYDYSVSRGRILGRNWGKSRKSFPPCYPQSTSLTDFTPSPPPPFDQKWFETG